MADLSIEVDMDQREVDRWQRLVEQGGRKAVNQLSTLAERHMKEEAPEGAGIPEVNLRTTITPETVSTDPYRVEIAPRKKTEQGWPLHHAIIEGTSYNSGPPPLEPILQWARAKITPDSGDTMTEAAEAIRWAIWNDGHETFPNRFVDRSLKKWEGRAGQIAQDAVDDAFSTGGGI